MVSDIVVYEKEQASLEEIMEKLKGIDLSEKPEEDYKEYMDKEFVAGLLEKLMKEKTSDEDLNSIFKILAEIAKTDTGRTLCSVAPVFKEINSNLLKDDKLYNSLDDAYVNYQVCRLLGNVCYDSESSRQLAFDNSCHDALLHLLNSLCQQHLNMHHTSTNHQPTTTNHQPTINIHQTTTTNHQPTTTNHQPTTHKRIKTAASALINLLDDHLELQEAVLKGGLMDVVGRMMEVSLCGDGGKERTDGCLDDIVDVCLSLIEFYHLSKPQVKVFLTTPTTHHLFLKLLQTTHQQPTIDQIFHTITTFAEDDEMKVSLVKSSFVADLVNMMEGGVKKEGGDVGGDVGGDGSGSSSGVEKGGGDADNMIENKGGVDDEGVGEGENGGLEEFGRGLKMGEQTNDLLILLLTGDESMSLLFEAGTAPAYRCIRSWLGPLNDLKLQTAGVFAMCNFARSDANCKVLIGSGIVDELLFLLRQHDSTTPHHLIQHAIFGTLVNLAISPSNRSGLGDEVVTACLSFHHTTSLTVLFKVLACLRMMSNKNEAVVEKVVNDDLFMKMLDQSTTHDHKGIMSEALRLFSCLIRNTTSQTLLKRITSFNALKNILRLSDCEHYIMKNESVLSLIHLFLYNALDDEQLEGCKHQICQLLDRMLLPEILSKSSSSQQPSSQEPSSQEASSQEPPQQQLPTSPSQEAPQQQLKPPPPSQEAPQQLTPPPPPTPSSLSNTSQPVEVICNALNVVVLSKNIPCLKDELRRCDLYRRVVQHHHQHQDQRVINVLMNV